MKGNKTILGSILAISLVSIILAGSYTGAFFMDVETSEDNSFSAGLLDMKIRDNDESFKDGVTATWTATDIKPGDEWTFDVPFVELQKTLDSIEADHTEITCDYSVIEEDPCLESDTDCDTDQHPDDMAKEMIITRCVYYRSGDFCIDCLTGKKYTDFNANTELCGGSYIGQQSNNWKIEDQNGDGKISFYDLKYDKLDNLPPLNSGIYDFEMSVKFDEDAGNDFQGDTFNLTMKFILNQDASQ